MTMKCNTCKLEKPEAEMYMRGGKVIRTCCSCREAQVKKATASRAKTMQSVKISRPVEVQASAPAALLPAPDPVIASPVLDIPPSWGLNAVIEDGRLLLRQSDDAGNTDEIGLSRSEASTLFARFRAWAA
jgi:hypothetical protein